MKNEILTKNQLNFLKEFSQSSFLLKNFYLTGGTALAGFYLGHRYSEDLDFFSEKEFDLLNIKIFLKKIKKKLGFKKDDLEQSYNRNLIFLHFPDEIVKTEFTYFPFMRIQKGKNELGIEIDSLFDIAVNKLFSIYQRSKARDYVDLYFLCQKEKYTIEELVKKARIKFDTHIDFLQLGKQFIKSQTVDDYPRMIAKIKSKEWQEFFIGQALKLKKNILE